MNFFYSDDENDSMYFVKGHLYIEFALNNIIEKAYAEPSALKRLSGSFANKIMLLRAIGRLSPEMESYLKEFNRMRNKLAHEIDYELNYDEIIEIARKAHNSEVEFVDVNMYNALDGNRGHYEVHDVIEELISGSFYSLFKLNEDLYPNEEYSKYTKCW